VCFLAASIACRAEGGSVGGCRGWAAWRSGRFSRRKGCVVWSWQGYVASRIRLVWASVLAGVLWAAVPLVVIVAPVGWVVVFAGVLRVCLGSVRCGGSGRRGCSAWVVVLLAARSRSPLGLGCASVRAPCGVASVACRANVRRGVVAWSVLRLSGVLGCDSSVSSSRAPGAHVPLCGAPGIVLRGLGRLGWMGVVPHGCCFALFCRSAGWVAARRTLSASP